MARKAKEKQETSFSERKDLKKLSLYFVIVNRGQAQAVTKLMDTIGISCEFVQRGTGTATRQVRDILGIEDNDKDIIYAIVAEDKIPEISREMSAYFASSKRTRGIGFSVPMESIISVRMYSFLADYL